MSGEPVTTLIGNIGTEPVLSFTSGGAAVCNFSLAATPRSLDKASGEWRDGEAFWVRCAIWRQAAETVSESLTKGTRVIVHGKLKMRSYEKDGQKRTVVEMDVDEIGASLAYATVTVNRTSRSRDQAPAAEAGADQWAAAAPAEPAF